MKETLKLINEILTPFLLVYLEQSYHGSGIVIVLWLILIQLKKSF